MISVRQTSKKRHLRLYETQGRIFSSPSSTANTQSWKSGAKRSENSESAKILQVMPDIPRIFSYVVEHDCGHAPNPFWGTCTLAMCKFGKDGRKNIIELAGIGDWVVGTGGANLKKSAGHGKLIYAMKVGERLTLRQYYSDKRFRRKRPRAKGTYDQTQGDNCAKTTDRYALIGKTFYYFGCKAVVLPPRFERIQKTGPGFKSRKIAPEFRQRFIQWLTTNFEPGMHGEPWDKPFKEARMLRDQRERRCK